MSQKDILRIFDKADFTHLTLIQTSTPKHNNPKGTD